MGEGFLLKNTNTNNRSRKYLNGLHRNSWKLQIEIGLHIEQKTLEKYLFSTRKLTQFMIIFRPSNNSTNPDFILMWKWRSGQRMFSEQICQCRTEQILHLLTRDFHQDFYFIFPVQSWPEFAFLTRDFHQDIRFPRHGFHLISAIFHDQYVKIHQKFSFHSKCVLPHFLLKPEFQLSFGN